MQTFQLLFAKRAPATGTAATARKPGDGADNDDKNEDNDKNGDDEKPGDGGHG